MEGNGKLYDRNDNVVRGNAGGGLDDNGLYHSISLELDLMSGSSLKMMSKIG